LKLNKLPFEAKWHHVSKKSVKFFGGGRQLKEAFVEEIASRIKSPLDGSTSTARQFPILPHEGGDDRRDQAQSRSGRAITLLRIEILYVPKKNTLKLARDEMARSSAGSKKGKWGWERRMAPKSHCPS
jgi:hypothetical protein